MGGDLKPDLSALQVKVLFTKQHSYLLRKTTNVHMAGPFVSQSVLKLKTGSVIYQVATWVGRPLG